MSIKKPPKEAVEALHPITKAQYQLLANAAIQAAAESQENFKVLFSVWCGFPKGFPKGHRVEFLEGDLVVRKQNTVKTLNWLYKNGHTKVSVEDLENQKRSLSRRLFNADSFMNVEKFIDNYQDGE